MKMEMKMMKDYEDILNLNYDEKNKIPLTTADSYIDTNYRTVEKLDGMWGFMPDVFRTLTRKNLFIPNEYDQQGRYLPVDLELSHMEQVEVPGNWNCIKEKYWYYEGEAVYTRTFVYEKEQSEERVFLKIGAANYECRVWLNGKLLARHKGGFTPFCFEVTKDLKRENRIIITVNNRREVEQIPSMSYDWFNYGGITRTVELFRLPHIFIKNLSVSLIPDGTYENIHMKLELNEAKENQICHFVIEELDVNEVVKTDSNGCAFCNVRRKPELWNCENPRLYHVRVNCNNDEAEDFVGFREIRVVGNDILLNGKKIFLRGACCHEESKTGGRALTDEERMEILNSAREMGCNILRLTHYPHSERMAILADRVGMLLWEEIPVYWAIDFSNEKTYKDAQNQMRELILRDQNRASVVIWSVGNENPDTDDRLTFMRNLIDTCKELDHTRLVSAACLVDVDSMCVKDRLSEFVDILAFNEYYGWYYRDYEGIKEILDNTIIAKPIMITETGAGAKAGHHGGNEELFTEEHQAKVYEKQIEYTDGRIQGFFPWVLYDFISPIRMNPLQDGKNSKGLIAIDKKYRKKAFYVLQEYYQKKQSDEKLT